VTALIVSLVFGAAGSATAKAPVTGPDLVLWLDAQNIVGKGGASNQPLHGKAIATWVDQSSYHNDTFQTNADQRPTYVRDALDGGLQAVHFEAAKRQHLSAGNRPSLDLSQFTAFVVAQAAKSGSDMWLVSKNEWGPPWTGYGIAISKDTLRPQAFRKAC
jgi:hypothetical protein